jgi:excisionase family DNA binding protein
MGFGRGSPGAVHRSVSLQAVAERLWFGVQRSKERRSMPASEEYPQVLDSAMVAEMLGMNVQVVRRLAREGSIPAYRLPGGRSFRFFRDEVLAWLKSFPVGEPIEEQTDT